MIEQEQEKEQDKDSGEEYRQFIKQSVETGSFYKDSFDWYMFRYVGPICDRTWLLFTTFISFAVFYILITLVISALPIVQKVPVIVKAKDATLYYPVIKPLRDSDDLKTIEESIIKYLAIRYVKEREEFNFITLGTADLNNKLNIIKNNSTPDEFNKFKAFLSLNNPNSPIRNFGKDVTRQVNVTFFEFERDLDKDFVKKAKDFVYIPIPSKANIEYELITTSDNKQTKQKYIAKIIFKFSNIDPNNLAQEMSFKVSDYNLFIESEQAK